MPGQHTSLFLSRHRAECGDVHRLASGIGHDELAQVGLNNPETNGQRSQIFPNASGKWQFREPLAGLINRFLNPVGCFRIILGDVAPNFKEIISSSGSKSVGTYARCYFEGRARSRSLTRERTSLFVDQFSSLGRGIAFCNLGLDFRPIRGEPGLLFVEQRDGTFHEFIDRLVRPTLNVPDLTSSSSSGRR